MKIAKQAFEDTELTSRCERGAPREKPGPELGLHEETRGLSAGRGPRGRGRRQAGSRGRSATRRNVAEAEALIERIAGCPAEIAPRCHRA
jgi:hypothetical protein